MEILFFVEPLIELQNIKFRIGAVKNFAYRQALLLENEKSNATVLMGEATYIAAKNQGVDFGGLEIRTVSSKELLRIFNSYYEASLAWYDKSFTGEEINVYTETIKESLGAYTPDVVVCWETLAPYFEYVFNKRVPVIHAMPGFVSRVPYAELTYLDANGIFGESSLVKYRKELDKYVATQEELKVVEYLRACFKDGYFNNYNPFSKGDLDPAAKFKYLVLLPLQVSGYFAFDHASGFKSQFDFMVWVLNQLSPEVGLVVTQYVTPNTSDKVITDSNIDTLVELYPNLIYKPEFDEIDGVSQYLLPFVDAVITVSSSLGIQAAIWDIPVVAIGNSHVKTLAVDTKISQISEFLQSKRYKLGRNDSKLAWLCTRLTVVTVPDLYQSTRFIDVYKKLSSFQGSSDGFENYPIISEPIDFIKKFSSNTKLELAKKKALDGIGNKSVKARLSKRDELFNRISNADTMLVSFDIFDTLLQRPTEKPIDVFELINDYALNITSGFCADFKSERVRAEQELKREIESNSNEHKIEEITLDEIYFRLKSNLGLTDEMMYLLKDKELDSELKLLQPRPEGKLLYDYAVLAGKQVIVVSDMYLPESFIEKLLRINGFVKHDKLFLSSSIGLKKHTGSLFSYVIEKMRVNAQNILHVGDNKHGDIVKANEKGINTIYLQKAVDNFYQNKRMRSLFFEKRKARPLYESLCVGLIAHGAFESISEPYFGDTHFNRSSYNLGFVGLGSFFFSFAKWIIEESIRDKIKNLYFLSRDGEIIKKVYDIISPLYEGAPTSHYLLSSRRSARVATLYSREDIVSLCNTAIYNSNLNEVFKNKLGVELKNSDLPLVKEVGFNDLASTVSAKNDKSRFLSLALKLEDRILANACFERENLIDYLHQSGLSENSNSAVVDIGYAGSMQASISRLVNVKVGGYYLLTFLKAREVHKAGMFVKAFSDNFVDPKASSNPICQFGLIFETVFSNNQGSFVRMNKRVNGELIPELENTSFDNKKVAFLEECHQGITKFSEQMVSSYGNVLTEISFDSNRCLQVFFDFLQKPSGRDAELFESVIFDDAFSGAGIRYVVPPRNWAPMNDEVLAKCVWKQGTQVFLRRPDIANSPVQASKKNEHLPTRHSSINASGKKNISNHLSRPKREKSHKLLRPVIKKFWSVKQYNKFLRSPDAFYKDSKVFFWIK